MKYLRQKLGDTARLLSKRPTHQTDLSNAGHPGNSTATRWVNSACYSLFYNRAENLYQWIAFASSVNATGRGIVVEFQPAAKPEEPDSSIV